MSRTSDTKGDHPIDVNTSSISVKKLDHYSMEKDTRNRYSTGSSSAFLSSQNSSMTTKKLVIKNLKSSSKQIFPLTKKNFSF